MLLVLGVNMGSLLTKSCQSYGIGSYGANLRENCKFTDKEISTQCPKANAYGLRNLFTIFFSLILVENLEFGSCQSLSSTNFYLDSVRSHLTRV